MARSVEERVYDAAYERLVERFGADGAMRVATEIVRRFKEELGHA